MEGGGGVRVRSSIADIRNCIIRNCIAMDGAGLSISSEASVSLTNNLIYQNRAIRDGGGMIYAYSNSISFSTENPNSIYNNTAAVGMDFFISTMEDNPNPTNIILNLGSRALTEPDDYYITLYHATATVNIAQSYFPLIDSDVYVNPTGSDGNNGLTASTPFQTIKYALQVINSNPNTPRTVHLASGTYSRSVNGQSLPLSLKPHIKIIGAGIGQTILDGELNGTFFAAWNMHYVYLSDVTCSNGRAERTNPIEVVESSDIELRNLSFSNNFGAYSAGIYLLRCNDAILENLDIGNTTLDECIVSISAIECNDLYINDVICHNNHMTFNQEYFIGISLSESDVVLRNSIISNNQAPDAHVLDYQNVDPANSANNLDMSNVLVINNSIAQNMQSFAPVYLQNRFQTMKIYNCTFANNTGGGLFSRIFGYADIRNHISYNPGQNGEMFLHNHVWSDIEWIWYDTEVSISNSLFRSNAVVSMLPNLVTFTDNIFNGNPLFLGSTTDTLDVSQPEYYYLNANSPCINSGVSDTTGMNLPPMDLAGNQRIWDNRIDMGCFEYGAPPYVSNNEQIIPDLTYQIQLSMYPNPIISTGSNGSAAIFIEFTVPSKLKEEPLIEIFNIKGQKVKTIRLSESYNSMVRKAGLPNQVKQNGEFYSTVWNGKQDNNKQVSSGTYLVRVSADGNCATKKICIIK